MSILDDKLELMDATSIAANANATVAADSYLDLGLGYDGWGQAKTLDIGEGGDLWLNVRVATTITPAASSTENVTGTFYLYSHTTSTIASGTALLTKAYSASTMGQSAGTTVLRAKIPAGTMQRYVGVNFVNGATTITAGALDAWISLDSESELPTT